MVAIEKLRSTAELAASNRVVDRAWRAAYAGIVSDSALEHVSEMAAAPPTERRLSAITAPTRSQAYLAVDDEAIVGSAWMLWDPDRTKPFAGRNEAELRLLYVDPTRWGEGIGTQLLDACAECLPADVEREILETLVGNERGRRFYAGAGFREVGRSIYEVGDETYPTVVLARDR